MKRSLLAVGKMVSLRGTAKLVCLFVFLSGIVTPLVLLYLDSILSVRAFNQFTPLAHV